MLAITGKQMREIDRYTIEEIGIPSIVLMENAKNALMKHIPKDYEKFIVLVGVGNNGGDGVAMFRDLLLMKKDCVLVIVGNLEKASKDFLVNYNIVKNLNGKIFVIDENLTLDEFKKMLDKDVFLIEGLFGTGLSRDIKGVYKDIIDIVNESEVFKFSIDIPSGVDSETGKIYNVAIDSDYVVTLACMKKGLLNWPKKVYVEDIGIPEIVVKKVLNIE